MNTNFIVFGLTRPGIEPVSTASVADALSTRPLIGPLNLDRLCKTGILLYTAGLYKSLQSKGPKPACHRLHAFAVVATTVTAKRC